MWAWMAVCPCMSALWWTGNLSSVFPRHRPMSAGIDSSPPVTLKNVSVLRWWMDGQLHGLARSRSLQQEAVVLMSLCSTGATKNLCSSFNLKMWEGYESFHPFILGRKCWLLNRTFTQKLPLKNVIYSPSRRSRRKFCSPKKYWQSFTAKHHHLQDNKERKRVFQEMQKDITTHWFPNDPQSNEVIRRITIHLFAYPVQIQQWSVCWTSRSLAIHFVNRDSTMSKTTFLLWKMPSCWHNQLQAY